MMINWIMLLIGPVKILKVTLKKLTIKYFNLLQLDYAYNQNKARIKGFNNYQNYQNYRKITINNKTFLEK